MNGVSLAHTPARQSACCRRPTYPIIQSGLGTDALQLHERQLGDPPEASGRCQNPTALTRRLCGPAKGRYQRSRTLRAAALYGRYVLRHRVPLPASESRIRRPISHSELSLTPKPALGPALNVKALVGVSRSFMRPPIPVLRIPPAGPCAAVGRGAEYAKPTMHS